MKKLWLIIKREYLTRVRKRSFILGTLLTPLAFGLFFIVVGFIFSYESDEEKIVAVIDKGNILENTTKKALLNKLSVETFILDVDSNLEKAPDIQGFTTRINNEGQLEVDISKQQNINQLFDKLHDFSWRVTSMRSKSNRLEELFLDLVETGKPA